MFVSYSTAAATLVFILLFFLSERYRRALDSTFILVYKVVAPRCFGNAGKSFVAAAAAAWRCGDATFDGLVLGKVARTASVVLFRIKIAGLSKSICLGCDG